MFPKSIKQTWLMTNTLSIWCPNQWECMICCISWPSNSPITKGCTWKLTNHIEPMTATRRHISDLESPKTPKNGKEWRIHKDHVGKLLLFCVPSACLFMTAPFLPLPCLKPLLQAHASRLTTDCYGISPTKVSLPSPLNQGSTAKGEKQSQIPRPSGPICIDRECQFVFWYQAFVLPCATLKHSWLIQQFHNFSLEVQTLTTIRARDVW